MAWRKAYDAVITINSKQHDIVEGSYEETAGEADATRINGGRNAAGLLAEEFDFDVASTKLNITFEVDSVTNKDLQMGRFYPVSYVNANGITKMGTWGCTGRSEGIATKGLYRVACQGKFTGVVANQ